MKRFTQLATAARRLPKRPVAPIHPASWFWDLALPIASTVVLAYCKTQMHVKAFKREGFSESDQQLLHTQEWIRQIISNSLWIVSTLASYMLLDKLFPSRHPLGKVMFSNLLSSIPDTFVRPFITARLSRHFLGEKPSPLPRLQSHFSTESPPFFTSPPSQPIKSPPTRIQNHAWQPPSVQPPWYPGYGYYSRGYGYPYW